MLLKNINLINFRNFKNKKIDFHPSLTLISGMNSQGKTNILEGIHFLINGVGIRETKEEELLFFNEKEGLVEGNFDESGNITSYLIKLYFVGDKLNKVFFIDKTRKKHQQYLQQQTKTVLFSPEQINIIIGSPQLRRDYFDKLISLFDWEYKKRLVNYHLALKKRNKILELKADKENLKEELSFWDKYLIDQGSYLTKKREEYLDFLNSYQSLDSKSFYISYLKNEITQKTLDDSFEESLRYRKTIVGPQKDDFQIYLANEKIKKNIHSFGSRSEQRLAIFWLKINEIRYFEKTMKIKPIILLDDIFSELDESNKKIIFSLIKNYQTIATTAEKEIMNLIDIDYEEIELK